MSDVNDQKDIPAAHILTEIITSEIKGNFYDFEVTYTIFGEVLKVKSLFLESPIEAQKMITGKEYKEVAVWVKAYGDLLFFIIPMIRIGLIEQKEINLFQKIDLSFEPILKEHIFYIKGDWTKALYTEYLKNRKEPSAYLTQLTATFRSYTKRIRDFSFRVYYKLTIEERMIDKEYRILSFPILKTIIPIVYESKLSTIYKEISQESTAENKAFLYSQFVDKERQEFQRYMISAFVNYQDKEIYQQLLNWYYKNKEQLLSANKSQHFLQYYLIVLKNHEAIILTEVAWDIFKLIKFPYCNYALKILLENNQEKQVATFLYQALEKAIGQPKLIRHLLNYLAQLPSKYQLSSYELVQKQILDAERYYASLDKYLVKYFEHLRLNNIETNKDINNTISILLNHERASIRRAGLIFIKTAAKNKNTNPVYQQKDEVLALMLDSRITIQLMIMKVIEETANYTVWKDAMEDLIRKLFKNNRRMREGALGALNNVLKHGGWHSNIVSTYISILHNSNYYMSRRVLIGLEYCHDYQVLEALEKWKRDLPPNPNKFDRYEGFLDATINKIRDKINQGGERTVRELWLLEQDKKRS